MEFLKEYAWVLGIILAPLLYWIIQQIAKPIHRYIDKNMKDGDTKNLLIEENYSETVLKDLENKKSTEHPKDHR